MKALVTGAGGFIGRNLVAELRSHGHEVLEVDKRWHSTLDLHCDLADPSHRRELEAAGAEVDVVFHLAARPGVRDDHPDVERLRRRDNVMAAGRLFEAIPLSVPVVATSSSSVYGGAVRQGAIHPCREDDRLRPRGSYAASKVEMERLCGERRVRGGVVTVLRPFTVVGEYQRDDMALARWSRALREGRPIRLLGSPDRTRDLTDVRDVVVGLIRAAEVRHNGVINLGTGVGHRLSEMAAALVEACGLLGEIVVEQAAPEEVEATLADTTSCERLLGFVPSTDLISVARRVWESTSRTPQLAGMAAR